MYNCYVRGCLLIKSFDEFVNDFPTNSCCIGSCTAKAIYEFITSDGARIKMATFAEVGVTPLSAVVDQIIEIATGPNSDFSLDTKLHRQTVGRMVTESLFDLGYIPSTRARVLTKNPKNTFTTAVTYSLTDEGDEYIYKEIRRYSK